MKSRAPNLKLHLVIISILLLTLSIFFLSASLNRQFIELNHHLENDVFDEFRRWIILPPTKYSLLFDFLAGKLQGMDIKIGLVNMPSEEEIHWKQLGDTTMVHFDRVRKDRRWEDYFPEWIDEDETKTIPKCPDLPMPNYTNYTHFNLLVIKMPCGNEEKGKGVRDVFRLQLNLVAANLAVHNGNNKNMLVVFISSCGPMWEIFRCDDLLKHEEDFWIYRPDLRRLKQKISMPVGTCQIATPPKKNGGGNIAYDFSKLGDPIDRPKEAYVTLLHSSEAYVCGAIVLAQSIIQTNSTKDLVLLADQSIKSKSRQALKAAGWKIKNIERIRCPTAEKGAYNEWNYSKLRLWQLTEYDKVIFIDSDFTLFENIDKFFLYPQLSAVINNRVKFNSGLMLIEPSQCTFDMLMQKRFTVTSYNGGDQGLLNEVFTWWHKWPTRLNYLKSFKPTEAYRQYMLPESLYAIHYLGLKPWACPREYDCNWNSSWHREFANNLAHWKWWEVHDKVPKELTTICDLPKVKG